ncbi:MAG: tetratricopeptide repeat protein, partial [Bacteroidales bacterium]|nr:tetratricopeptide repeat protein [Bacteroidales bacterium]
SLGIEYHLNLDFKNAVVHYRNAIGLDSTFTAAKASLGNILYEKFDPEEGKIWLDEAMSSIDNLTDREKYSILAFYASQVNKDLEKSIEYSMIMIELYPDNVIARNNLGWYFRNQGHYEKSVTEYKKAIQLDPYTMLPYAGLLWNYCAHLGQFDSAMFWTRKMLTYGPENPWAYFYLGVVNFAMDELEKAREAFEKVRELSPGIIVNLYNLAHTYRTLEKHELAIHVLKEIIAINPEESDAYYYQGISCELMGADETAIANYQKSLSMTEYQESENPHNPVTLMTKGTVLSRLGRKEEGMEVGKMGFEMDTAYHYSYAQVLAIQQYTEDALHHLEIALENGYMDLCWIKMDPDLSSLQNDERFLRLLERYFK